MLTVIMILQVRRSSFIKRGLIELSVKLYHSRNDGWT